MQRLFNYAFLAIIGLSVTAQLLRFGLQISGVTQGALAAMLDRLGVFIVLGTLLAFVKFVLSAVRSFRQPPARLQALCYGVILLLPVGLWLVVTLNGSASMTVSESGRQPELRQREAPPSQQFSAGQAWARSNAPSGRPQCAGSDEFVRGCTAFITEQRQAQARTGSDWARDHRPARGSQCQGTPHFVLGCRTYFVQHLAPAKLAGQGPFGTTTAADCKVEVNANYEVAQQLDLLDGNPHAAQSTRTRHWLPELRECENLDRAVNDTFMVQAYSRLEQLLGKMKAGGAASAQDKAAMLQDMTGMAALPDQPYQRAYQTLADEYLERLAGSYKEHKPVYPRISCAEYQAKITEMQKLEAGRVEAMQALRRPDGVITDGARHSELNQARISMLWDWKYFNDGAKDAGCGIRQ